MTEMVETDLAILKGVEELWATIGGRPVDALLANAGHGLGRAFLDQDLARYGTSWTPILPGRFIWFSL